MVSHSLIIDNCLRWMFVDTSTLNMMHTYCISTDRTYRYLMLTSSYTVYLQHTLSTDQLILLALLCHWQSLPEGTGGASPSAHCYCSAVYTIGIWLNSVDTGTYIHAHIGAVATADTSTYHYLQGEPSTAHSLYKMFSWLPARVW